MLTLYSICFMYRQHKMYFLKVIFKMDVWMNRWGQEKPYSAFVTVGFLIKNNLIEANSVITTIMILFYYHTKRLEAVWFLFFE